MANLEKWENLIKEKRSKTPFREFVKEIASWEVLNLYKNKGKISRYPDTERIKRLDDVEFQNAGKYALLFDFEKSFFQNFQALHDIFPFQHVMQFDGNENTSFADAVFGAKNTYLTFVTGMGTENIFYSAFVYINSTNIFNSFFVSTNTSNVYASWGVTKSYNIFYSRYISDSANIWFSTNLIGCEECIFCDGLENQKYCIENTIYSKEEYVLKKKWILQEKKRFEAWNQEVHKKRGKNFASVNTKGSYIVKCENIENSGWLVGIHNARNSLIGIGEGDCENFADCIDFGASSHDFFACAAAWGNSSQLYCSTQIDQCSYIYYGYFLQSCSFCIGCIGLKNKQFCILNKQYTKEEWYKLADKIFASMEQDGSLGKFFPPTTNPFYFNDTLASLIYNDFTKDEVEREGYLWRDEPIKVDIPDTAKIIETKDLGQYQWYTPEGKWEIKEEILEKVIRDPQWNFYKIVPMELEFLRKHSLPLPSIWPVRIK